MVVNTEFQDDVCILRLEGRFATGQDAEYLRAKADEVRNQGYKKIIADFSHVSYIDSTGLGFLISIYTSTLRMAHDGKFVLAGANPRVQEVLTITRLDTILPAYESVSAAVRAMA